jgi:hypothetical protein
MSFWDVQVWTLGEENTVEMKKEKLEDFRRSLEWLET